MDRLDEASVTAVGGLVGEPPPPPKKDKIWDMYLSCRFCNDSAMLKFLWFLSDIIISQLHNITRFWEILSPDPIMNPLPKPEPRRRTLLHADLR